MREGASWSEWLSSPDCQPVLKAAARFVYRMAAGVNLPPELLPCRDPRNLPEAEREECFEALAHELWIFLRSRSEEWMRRMSLSSSLHGNPRTLMLRIGQEFFRHLKDQARTSQGDPKRALYRKVRQLLADEPSIVYRATREGAFYALDPRAERLESLQLLRSEPYGSWESPLSKVSLKDLPSKKALIELAGFFWHRATERLGGAFFLPIRELVHFISCHYPGFSRPDTLSLEAMSTGRPGEDGPCWEPVADSPPPDTAFLENRLPLLAEQLVNGWTVKERFVFALLQGDGVGLKEAADRLGYKSSSGVAYLYESVRTSLRDFCLLWPGLSPPDLDVELFEHFVVQVVAFCKKTV
ncbi:MAG: hypothetical protein KBH99_10960 [Syntrophobacteraceae bacterium]|nr:hypothetical protein [Syntrophobacteraceae bacterium]